MVSEVVKNRLKNSVGKYAEIFLIETNFVYRGKISGCDDDYVEIIQNHNSKFKLIKLSSIKDAEVEL